MLTVKRPASGISPLFWDDIIGKKVARAVEEDTPLRWQDIID
jgi:sialic acid synthase SpsE